MLAHHLIEAGTLLAWEAVDDPLGSTQLVFRLLAKTLASFFITPRTPKKPSAKSPKRPSKRASAKPPLNQHKLN